MFLTHVSRSCISVDYQEKYIAFPLESALYFLMQKNPLKGIKMGSIEDPQHRGGTETILLVEDDSTARKVTKLMLEELGYCVIEGVNGEDALKTFHVNKDRIQLVILDVIMPHGSSKSVYDKMLVIRSDIKAIFISGYTEDILKETGMIEEGLHFLQ
ncbi:MAG: response regulator, partial [Thermodesulfovibrionales bacterium]